MLGLTKSAERPNGAKDVRLSPGPPPTAAGGGGGSEEVEEEEEEEEKDREREEERDCLEDECVKEDDG